MEAYFCFRSPGNRQFPEMRNNSYHTGSLSTLGPFLFFSPQRLKWDYFFPYSPWGCLSYIQLKINKMCI
jgi:hypothetical protein